ncbi:hypothetical protein ABFW14_08485 [Mycolicibacterium fortuitum]|uniref:hypothetical protein n=1 Tax=Mycolicibacterium fortuitum TaxID=1766 RepID=UPI0034CFADD6
MSNTDRIEQVLREQFQVSAQAEWLGTPPVLVNIGGLAYLIDAELHPVIETVEQLDALPDESVVLLHGPNGGAIQKRYGTWHWANDDGDDSWSSELESFLPARVLYTPEADHG